MEKEIEYLKLFLFHPPNKSVNTNNKNDLQLINTYQITTYY